MGLGPPDIGMKGARLINRIGYPYGWRIATVALTRWFWRWQVIGRVDLSDEKRLELLKRQVEKDKASANSKDLEVMQDEGILQCMLRVAKECFAQGFEGSLQDGRLACYDLGFRVEDIRPDLPVQLWYGKHDIHVPLNHGVQIAARLGGRAQLRIEDETHASLTFNWKEKIIEELVRSI